MQYTVYVQLKHTSQVSPCSSNRFVQNIRGTLFFFQKCAVPRSRYFYRLSLYL